jgi:Fibrobacter succinogenes major domain (Fib_succ_major).
MNKSIMKKILNISYTSFLILSIFLFHSCKKEKPTLPIVMTAAITDISYTTANSGGEVTNEGGAPVTGKGVCWNTSADPTISNSKTNENGGLGAFTSNLTRLTPNTLYYVRAYATNIAGTGYGEQVILKTYTGKVADVDGNVYYTVTINDRVWMAENLKTTTYANGSPITLSESSTINGFPSVDTTLTYCWYNIDINNKSTYGALYNWRGAMKGNPGIITNPADRQGACPDGWHVPDITEWTELTNFLGGDSIAGGKLKETGTKHWKDLNVRATNESGFTGIPGGYRSDYGIFEDLGYSGYWWSSTEDPDAYGMAYVRGLSGSVKYSFINIFRKGDAAAIRCIKD